MSPDERKHRRMVVESHEAEVFGNLSAYHFLKLYHSAKARGLVTAKGLEECYQLACQDLYPPWPQGRHERIDG